MRHEAGRRTAPRRGGRLFDVLQDAVKLVEIVVTDYDFARSFFAVIDGDLGAKLFGNLDLETTNVGIARDDRWRRFRPLPLAKHLFDETLGLAHREPLIDNLPCRVVLLHGIADREQGARMPHFDLP